MNCFEAAILAESHPQSLLKTVRLGVERPARGHPRGVLKAYST